MDNPGKKLNPKILSDQGNAFTATVIVSDDEVSTHLAMEDQLKQCLMKELERDRLVLPSLPDIAIRVGREMNEENTNAHKLANIIQTDPVITAKLIRAANSPLYAGASSVDSCNAAVVRLGANTTHNLVLTFALRELFITQSPLLKTHMQQLWKHSVKVSAICYVLAKIVGGFNPEQALLAGLLHDIGVVAILNYTKRFPAVLEDEATLNKVILDLRGVIGGRILRSWNFLDDLATAAEEAEDWLRDHTEAADYADLVVIAQLHSFIGTRKMHDCPPLDNIPALAKLNIGELTPKMSMKILDKAEAKINRAEALLNS
jgi:HD-like signal output (HDOD) protein